MKNYLKRVYNEKKYYSSILVGSIIFIMMLVFMFTLVTRTQKKEQVEVINNYSLFASEAGNVVISNILLLRGYLAYLNTNDVTGDETEDYLESLLGKNETYIRNITVIEDTTIKWVYPKEGNEAAIGVDLAAIEAQKDVILKIKEEHITYIQGPVNLVQGGQGLIARIPIMSDEDKYYGQLSIVMDLPSLVSKISDIAYRENLTVHITTAKSEAMILENKKVLEQEPLVFMLSDNELNWIVYAIPINGWKSVLPLQVISVIVSLIIGILAGLLVVYGIKTNDTLKSLAGKDTLTGLYNRRFLDEFQLIALSNADRVKGQVGFILMDLDGFKKVNDTLGHKAGDEVLVKTAELLKKNTRSNELIFRLGGDEFLIILPFEVSEEAFEVVCNRIKDAFLLPIKVQGHNLEISISMGISKYPQDGVDFDLVLHEADKKMYLHKSKKQR